MDWTKMLGANHANHLQTIPIKLHRPKPAACMLEYILGMINSLPFQSNLDRPHPTYSPSPTPLLTP